MMALFENRVSLNLIVNHVPKKGAIGGMPYVQADPNIILLVR
jgi:hypothetical protein